MPVSTKSVRQGLRSFFLPLLGALWSIETALGFGISDAQASWGKILLYVFMMLWAVAAVRMGETLAADKTVEIQKRAFREGAQWAVERFGKWARFRVTSDADPIPYLQVQEDYYLAKMVATQESMAAFYFGVLGSALISLMSPPATSYPVLIEAVLLCTLCTLSLAYFFVACLKYGEYKSHSALYRNAILAKDFLGSKGNSHEFDLKEVQTGLAVSLAFLRSCDAHPPSPGDASVLADALSALQFLESVGYIRQAE